jgi:rSAM-associated Gly-rich repeat protein
MSDLDRRQFFKSVFASLVQVAGTVVVASATASMARAQAGQSDGAEPPEDIQERADRLASAEAEETEETSDEFLNGAFRNTPLGGFGNAPIGGFRNTPLGAFRNSPFGHFRNTPLGPFANGGWRNSPWGGFRNGGWPNGAWRNWW